MVLIQQILNGLTMGSIYALLGIGVTMVFKSLGMMNVAHGDMMMLGAFVALEFFKLSLPLWSVIPLGIILIALLGLLMEYFIYRKLDFGIMLNLMIVTIGMQIILRNSALIVWGVEPKPFPAIFSHTPIKLGSFVIPVQSIGIILVTVVLLVLLQLFYYKTRTGKSMIVAAANPAVAAMLGINVAKTRFLTFGISSAFAAIAGILIAPMYFVSSGMGAVVGVKAFSAAVVGGFGNIVGAFYGGIILGIVESVGGGFISTAYKDALSFLVMILVLYFKPSGLFARRGEQKF
jgi:branched-chain amino acid transport system permease protein